MKKIYSIGEFAKITTNSTRTLQYYDDIGLLPAKRNQAGHRYYLEDDFEIMQRITSLKFLGFSLEDISQFIRHDNWAMKDSLVFQRELMEKKYEQIEHAIKLLDLAINQINENQKLDPQIYVSIINSVQMEEEHKAWMTQHFPEQFVNQVYGRAKQGLDDLNKKTMDLFSRFKEVMFFSPDTPEVEALVHELIAIGHEVAGGDYSNLEKLINDEKQLDSLDPWLFPSPFSAEEEKWLEQVMSYYVKKECEQNENNN